MKPFWKKKSSDPVADSAAPEPMAKPPSAPANGEAAPVDVVDADGFIEIDPEKEPLMKKSKRRDRMIMIITAVGLLGVFYFLFFSNSFGWLDPQVQVGVLKVEGKARVRHAGSWVWKDVNGETPIYQRDIIYVAEKSSAKVAVKNKTIDIAADTMIQIDETSLDRFDVTLIELNANQGIPLPLKTTKLSDYLPDLKPLELRVSELKGRTLNRVFANLRLASVERMVKNDFRLNKLSDYSVRAVDPLPERYNLKANRWMKISWSPVPLPDVSFKLEVAKESAFRSTLSHSTKINRVMMQFDEAAIYYWRVKISHSGDTIVTPLNTFTLSLTGGLLPGEKPKTREVTGGGKKGK